MGDEGSDEGVLIVPKRPFLGLVVVLLFRSLKQLTFVG